MVRKTQVVLLVKQEQHQEKKHQVVIIVDQENVPQLIKREVVQLVLPVKYQQELLILVALIVQLENIKDQKGNHHVIHVEQEHIQQEEHQVVQNVELENIIQIQDQLHHLLV